MSKVDEQALDDRNFNKVPDGLEEISEVEFAKSWFFWYAADKREYRQVIDEGRGWHCYELHMYHHRNTGIAMHSDHREKVTYYRFGCQHEWRELSQAEAQKAGKVHYGMCWHVCQCTKCGEWWSYDSSG